MKCRWIYRWAILAVFLVSAGSCALPLSSEKGPVVSTASRSQTVRIEVPGDSGSKGAVAISRAIVTVLSPEGEQWGSGSLTYANGWWTGDIAVTGTGPAVVRVAGLSAAGPVYYFGRTEATILANGTSIKVTLGRLNNTYDLDNGTTTALNYDVNGATGGTVDPVTSGPVLPDPVTGEPSLWANLAEAGSLSKAGYQFAGWTPELPAGHPFYAPGYTLTIVADPLLVHAVWVPNSLTFDNSGYGTLPITGNNSTDASSVPSGTIVLPCGVTSLQKRSDEHSLFTDPANDPNLVLTRLVIPATVTSIGNGTCRDLKALTQVSLPDTVELGGAAFYFDTALETVTLKAGTLGGGCFFGCSSLKTVTLGAGVTLVGMQAFQDCSSLTQVRLLAETPPTLEMMAFYRTPGTMKILVPADAVAAYKTASGWSDFASQIVAAP